MRRTLLATAAVCLGLAAAPPAALAQGQQEGAREAVRVVGHILEPERLEPTEQRLRGLRVPDGFRVERFADGLVNPRMLAVSEDGTVYVTRRSVGDVVMLRDTDGDGRADVRRSVASRPNMHGIAVRGRQVWLATIKEVYTADIRDDGSFGELRLIIDDLPDGGQHPNRTLGFGPDGKLYITVGSTCNACTERNQENATVLRAEPDGSRRAIFASGLRNTLGFDWHPRTREMWAMDMGIDWLGDQAQREELNRLRAGRSYGWPYVYEDGRPNPADEPPQGISHAQWARASEAPVQTYAAHASPMQFVFYDADQFPAEYRGDAFVALRGSWNRSPPAGYEVVRIRFDDRGEARSIEPFVSGFLVDGGGGRWGHLGRLAGLAVARDGSLLLTDDTNGVIYRISHGGGARDGARTARAPGRTARPEGGDRSGAGAGGGGVAISGGGPERLALAALGARGDARLRVRSPAFGEGQAIPRVFSEYGEGISPPLAWFGAPEGTRSFAILVEDPDAPGAVPFVHWTGWNLPADADALREGVPASPAVPVPPGLRQGRNSHGSVGYYGMKPPAGGGAHRYHAQVFALDTTLDLPPGADRAALLEAMRGHVLASGELVGTFAAP